VLRALLARGEQARALRYYREFEAWLAEEVGIAPHPETRALAAHLLAGEPQPRPVLPAPEAAVPPAAVTPPPALPVAGEPARSARPERTWPGHLGEQRPPRTTYAASSLMVVAAMLLLLLTLRQSPVVEDRPAAPAPGDSAQSWRSRVFELLRGPPDPSRKVVVDQRPRGFPAWLVPAGARVLTGTERTSGASVVLATTQTPAAAREELSRMLQHKGWRRRDIDKSAGPGFRGREPDIHLWCSGDEEVVLTVRRDQSNREHLLVNHYPRLKPSFCHVLPNPAVEILYQVPIPLLTEPAEAELVRWGGMGRSDVDSSRWAGVRLKTKLAPAKIMAHYAAQLQRARWVAEPATVHAPVASQVFTFKGAEEKWVATLFTWEVESGLREVELRLCPVQRQGRSMPSGIRASTGRCEPDPARSPQPRGGVGVEVEGRGFPH
jgi:hypothetical protein